MIIYDVSNDLTFNFFFSLFFNLSVVVIPFIALLRLFK